MMRALCTAVLVLLASCGALAATATSSCTSAIGWSTTPTNALAGPDSAYAITAITGQPQLQITNCAMGIPAGSTINGIQVRVVGCANGTTGQRTWDINVLGLGTCTLKPQVYTACATNSDLTLGGVADTWSCTGVSQSAVNANTFGASVSTDTSNSQTQQVDLVTITVTYTAGTGGPAAGARRLFRF